MPVAGVNSSSLATKNIANRALLAGLSGAALVAALGLAGCKSRPLPPPAPAPAPSAPVAAAPAPAPSAAPMSVRSMTDYRRRAAQMMVSANPGVHNSGGAQPEQWYGIAVVQVRLNADGSIRAVDLTRASKVAPEINQMALNAARRVGNYGPVGNLPQPWEFNETFLFDDNKRFQLVTIVEGR